jgi:hypothetical protein
MSAAAVWEPSDNQAADVGERQGRYPDLIAFVSGHLAPMVRRRAGGGRTWCPQWWRHPEAVERLTALWHAWETSRLDGGPAMSEWWTHHFDPHYAVLTDAERGPFQACGRDGHTDTLQPLPHDPLPPEWRWAWGVEATDPDQPGDTP